MSRSGLPALPADVSPAWRQLDAGEFELTATARVPVGLVFFADHFQGNPLVPGVVQLLWLQTLSEWAWPHRYLTGERGQSRLSGHQRVKFKKPVLPGDEIRIKLASKDTLVAFTIDNVEGRCTDGQLTYARSESSVSRS